MSRTEININQTEMERCITQIKVLSAAWNFSLRDNVCILARSKGKSAEMLGRCVGTTDQITTAMNELLNKTVLSFGTAKDKYEEVDICMARSMDGK